MEIENSDIQQSGLNPNTKKWLIRCGIILGIIVIWSLCFEGGIQLAIHHLANMGIHVH